MAERTILTTVSVKSASDRMDSLLYFVAKALIVLIQKLPLRAVARLGRVGGGLFYFLDARHRRVALANLQLCFGSEKPEAELKEIARENFRRIGENFACAVKTAVMEDAALAQHCSTSGLENILPLANGEPPPNRVVAIGHFGNFELYTRMGGNVGYQRATTYRGLRQPALDKLLLDLRRSSGCHFYERRRDASLLKTAMSKPGMVLGLLADQHAGDGGLRLPFLGHECSTSAAPALFALRYRCPLSTAICYRIGLAQWHFEMGPEIPTWEEGRPRSVEAISLDINRAFERAIRRDPANWFWVHKRWKPASPKSRRRPTPEPPAELRTTHG